MAIRVEHGKPSTLISAAKTRARDKAVEAGQAKQFQLERERENRQYQTSVRDMQMTMDLEAEKRARLWEIEKMELRSRMDFEREETTRQKKIMDVDNKIKQLELEREQGRFSADESAYAQAMSYWQMQKEAIEGGTKAPTVPWYSHPMMYGSPAAQAKRETMGKGTVPYYLEKEWLRQQPIDIAEQILASRDIFFDTPEQLKDYLETPTLPIESPEQGNVLDAETARQILNEAGGNKDRARQIARQRGYKF